MRAGACRERAGQGLLLSSLLASTRIGSPGRKWGGGRERGETQPFLFSKVWALCLGSCPGARAPFPGLPPWPIPSRGWRRDAGKGALQQQQQRAEERSPSSPAHCRPLTLTNSSTWGCSSAMAMRAATASGGIELRLKFCGGWAGGRALKPPCAEEALATSSNFPPERGPRPGTEPGRALSHRGRADGSRAGGRGRGSARRTAPRGGGWVAAALPDPLGFALSLETLQSLASRPPPAPEGDGLFSLSSKKLRRGWGWGERQRLGRLAGSGSFSSLPRSPRGGIPFPQRVHVAFVPRSPAVKQVFQAVGTTQKPVNPVY